MTTIADKLAGLVMAMPRVSSYLPPYNPRKASLAYGNTALCKLNREIQSVDREVCQQALLLLADVLHKRENLATAIAEGIPQSLKGLLTRKDPLIRERSAKVLQNMAQHSLGREIFLELEVITALSKLFSDPVFEVRVNAHSAIEMCARNIEGAKGTVAAGLVPLCVEKLVEEKTSQLKGIIMETLHWCFIVDTTDGLACEVIKTCQDLLGFVQPKIRGQAARLIFDLTLPLEGKEEACTVGGCIPKLIRLLDDLETFVRAQALAALMSCDHSSKYAILSPATLERLMDLLDDNDSEIRLNSIKLLSLLAEAPEGKKDLMVALSKLKQLSVEDPSDMVKKAAHTATKIITWLP